jgi:hypothetical protein
MSWVYYMYWPREQGSGYILLSRKHSKSDEWGQESCNTNERKRALGKKKFRRSLIKTNKQRSTKEYRKMEIHNHNRQTDRPTDQHDRW